ncbi:hypothetical protein P5G65_21770 [Paenibacillus chondroitinus]|uniref:Integron gene cassette protein n=1 Tax=Paenibacillus chondroitinus TaxID=59842 RepID=A0ABU6DFU3_9BACL|nr:MULTISPECIES: hypothetical protein [Paenibacillus]MCY9659126.1 hypothetical protein [Paenibacillus anseongense]MEB4796539.1 hypothetical protein [Paenibacillus chondroitinus]
MPYVLQNKNTEQLLTCMLVNHYGLAYYGVKFWPEQEEANEHSRDFLHSITGVVPEDWQVIELEDGEMKLCNVKLKNDPNLSICWLPTRKPELRKLEN